MFEDETLAIERRLFFSIAEFHHYEFVSDIEVNGDLLADLKRRKIDIFCFVPRSFLNSVSCKKYALPSTDEDVAIIPLVSYDHWFNTIHKHARNAVRKALKNGVYVEPIQPNEESIRSMWRIFNESQVRGGRKYSGYGIDLQAVRRKFGNPEHTEILGAYFSDELLGFIRLLFGDRVTVIQSFISSLSHRNLAPNNILLSEAVKRCCERRIQFLVYGNGLGYLHGLDRFRIDNGFKKYTVVRYYLPLSTHGQLAAALNLHREIPFSAKTVRILLPIYNLASKLLPQSIWQRFAGL